MTDALAELLDPLLPSGLLRKDAELEAKGLAADALAGAKAAVTAVALAREAKTPASPDLRGRLLASVGRPGRYGIFADRLARLFGVSIDAATALCAKLEDDGAWQPFLVPGVDMIPVEAGPEHAGAVATLVRFQPGTVFPAHDHRGDETMFVLDGGFRELREGGQDVWRGDELHSRDGSGHGLLALDGVPCIAAAIVTGYADFR